MSLVVIVVEGLAPRVHGELRRWMLEPRVGTFVGSVEPRVRDGLWTMVEEGISEEGGGGVMILGARNEQGFRVRMAGTTRRSPVDFEGLVLIREPLTAADAKKLTTPGRPR